MGRGLQIITSTLGHLRQSQDRINKINDAKIEREQKNTLFDLKKKKFELDIQEKQTRGDVDRFEADMMRQMFGNQAKAQKANFQVEDDMIETALTKETRNVQDLTGLLKQGVQQEVREKALGRLNGHPVSNAMTPVAQSDYDTSYTSRGGISIKPKKTKQVKQETPLEKRKSIWKMAQGMAEEGAEGGTTKDYLGEAEKYLYPDEYKEPKQFSVKDFPKEIKTKPEAYNFLTQEIGMDDIAARQWIEDNN